MSGAMPLLPPPAFMRCSQPSVPLHDFALKGAVRQKTPTELVDGPHRRGSERELPVFETGMRKWWGCRAVNKFCVQVI